MAFTTWPILPVSTVNGNQAATLISGMELQQDTNMNLFTADNLKSGPVDKYKAI